MRKVFILAKPRAFTFSAFSESWKASTEVTSTEFSGWASDQTFIGSEESGERINGWSQVRRKENKPCDSNLMWVETKFLILVAQWGEHWSTILKGVGSKPSFSSVFNIMNLWNWNSGCCTAVEHMPAERKNSWGYWFDYKRDLFSLFQFLSGAFLIRSLREVQHYWFFHNKKNWCVAVAAWGESSFGKKTHKIGTARCT